MLQQLVEVGVPMKYIGESADTPDESVVLIEPGTDQTCLPASADALVEQWREALFGDAGECQPEGDSVLLRLPQELASHLGIAMRQADGTVRYRPLYREQPKK